MATEKELLRGFVARRLRALAALPEHPRKAALANLRRGVGHAPGDLPELWGAFLEDLPPELESKNGRPTKAEWAAYLALTFYALHQQGHDLPSEDMNRPGEDFDFGKAVRRLADATSEKPEDAPVLRRFNALATAEATPERAHHLRGIVQLLRAEGVPLDYVRLAEDLYWLQIPAVAPRIRLKWGQDYYHSPKEENTEEEN